MAKKKKIPKEEIIPEGMSRKDYADAAFRKKVTIINLCILAVFAVGVVAVIVAGWYNTKLENERFEQIEQAFFEERDAVKSELEKIEKDGGSHDDKSQVKINVTDDTFYYWITTLDESYQTADEEAYAAFGGAEIHLQGMFIEREFSGGAIQYWVYRQHSHDGQEHSHDHEHDEDDSLPADMIPIEVIFDEDVEIPEDGTWVDVKGIVGPDSTKSLSGIRYAQMSIMDEPGNVYVE
ncbi:MAG: hypothetical protein IJN94_02820 [Clostridia bacterium]|nr:hypothetical protein [Clostridia bacterium]